MLEESYKMEISVSRTAKTKPVSMTDISPLWEEMALKTWLLYAGELKLCGNADGDNNRVLVSCF